MRCPYCGSEVTPGTEACPRCQVRIVWHDDAAEFHMPDSYVPVFIAHDPMMLPVVESLLVANGIPFIVQNETTQDVFGLGRLGIGYSAAVGPPVVRVPGEYQLVANELIGSARNSPSEHGTFVE